jgi:hypothetical protein
MHCNKPLAENLRRQFRRTRLELPGLPGLPEVPKALETPEANPYLGTACEFHREEPQKCGLLLSKRFEGIQEYASSILDTRAALTDAQYSTVHTKCRKPTKRAS